MKSKILISINPVHANNILNGTKKYEYRRKTAKTKISTIIIYETSPIKRIVGEAEVEDVLKFTPNTLWEKTKEESGISKDFFDDYFENVETACAYKLGKVTMYDEPKSLEDYGIKSAPQSFIYI